MFAPVLVEAASAPLLTLDTVRKHVGAAGSVHFDELLALFRDAATATLEVEAGIAITEQTWRQDFASFAEAERACGEWGIPLRQAPVLNIVSVKYRDTDDVEQTVSSSVYRLLADELGSYVARAADQSWPSDVGSRTAPVSITYEAGLTALSPVHPGISIAKAAALLHIGHLFKNRESVVIGTISSMLPMGYDALVAKIRRYI